MTRSPNDLLGKNSIALMFSVKVPTVAQWDFLRKQYAGEKRRQGAALMPDPHDRFDRTNVWRRSDLEAWAKDTGREIYQSA